MNQYDMQISIFLSSLVLLSQFYKAYPNLKIEGKLIDMGNNTLQ